MKFTLFCKLTVDVRDVVFGYRVISKHRHLCTSIYTKNTHINEAQYGLYF